MLFDANSIRDSNGVLSIVLLPGMDGTGELFGPFVEELKDEFSLHVVAYPTDRALGYEELEDWVSTRLPETGPMLLLGESFSGPIALAVAAALPARVAGLILCCTFAKNPRPSLAPFGALLASMRFGRPPAALLDYALLGRFSTPSLRTMLLTAVGSVSPAVMRARLRAVLSIDATSAAATVRAPILYLGASEDRVVPPAALKVLEEACPSLRSELIEGPHWLLQAAPAAAAKAVRKFIAGLAASAAS